MNYQIEKVPTLLPINLGVVPVRWLLTTGHLRARSHNEFISKIGIVEEEADESTFWLDILPETKNSQTNVIEPLVTEARELTAIFTAASKTAKSNRINKN